MKYNTKYISGVLSAGLLMTLILLIAPTSLQAQTQVCAPDSVMLQLGTYNGTVQWQESADNVTYTNIAGATAATWMVLPGTTTYYRAEITDGSCDPVWSDTAEVVPATYPTLTNAGSDTLCAGASTTLMASSGASYLWSTGDTASSISVSAAGTYWVTVTDSNGCTFNTDTTTITVLLSLLASAGADATVPCQDTVTLGNFPAASGGLPPYAYAWTPAANLSNPAIANPQAIVPSTTTYSLIVTDAFGCTATDSVTITTTGGGAGPDSVTFAYTGAIVEWIVPSCVSNIRIQTWGASGGNSTWSTTRTGGSGAYAAGDVTVNPGDTLKILVGQQGETAAVGGGGGGSFVATIANVPLMVAGGGGGASSDNNGVNASITTSGTMDFQNLIAGGTGGMGGAACTTGQNNGGGGGGFMGNGSDAQPTSGVNWGRGGASFVNGGAGGVPGRLDNACTGDPYGGFGGGGSATCNTVGGGGGGGYSGGAGGPHISNCGASPRAAGGGGGSFNAGTNQTMTPAANTGNGQIRISW